MQLYRTQRLVGISTTIALFVMVLAVVSHAAAPKLIAAFFVKGKVGLKWQKMEGVTEFAVYRKSDGDFAKLASVEDDHYFDTDLTPGTVYTYKVAVSDGGQEIFSAEKSVTIPGMEAGSFVPPTWSGLRIDQDKIFLNWDAVPGAIAYNVHRSTIPGSGYDVIGNTQASKYADKADLVKGTTYYYVLSALNAEFEETGFTEERSIKFGISLEEQQALEAAATKIELEPTVLTELFEMTEAGSDQTLNQPADIFVNAAGDIYVTDALNARVVCFSSTGSYKYAFGDHMDRADVDSPPDGAFMLPFTLFIDKQNQVYVTDVDRHDIQVFTADGEFVRRIQVATGDGMAALRPNGIHVLDDGRIVLTDTGNHRWMIVDQSGKILLSVGERGSEEGQFNFPDELTVTTDNTVCVVDVLNNRVQMFDLEGKFLRAFGSVGESAGTFARPKAITQDEKGRIWVSDGMSNVIQGFTMEGEVKSAVGATDDATTFITPRGIFFHDGRFYVVNRVKNRVVVYKVG